MIGIGGSERNSRKASAAQLSVEGGACILSVITAESHEYTLSKDVREPASSYQISNMYTCIAYLIEIRKFCSKNLVHKGVNFEAQNALKLTYEHL